jgi:hypothetical protein
MLDVERWVKFVGEVGFRLVDETVCDVCHKEKMTNWWMCKEELASHGSKFLPEVCAEHGREYDLVW